MFTDGFSDQFGGPRGNKFKKSRMLSIFEDVANESVKNQKNSLVKALEDWQGNEPQLDDICVLIMKF